MNLTHVWELLVARLVDMHTPRAHRTEMCALCMHTEAAMARLTVWVPDELVDTVRRDLPGLNVSAALRSTLERLVTCEHGHWSCTDCGSHVDAEDQTRREVRRFWFELTSAMEPIVWRVGTAEGAAAAAWDVASSWGLSPGPRVRPTRSERDAAAWKNQQQKASA